jgi:hypothetical protein
MTDVNAKAGAALAAELGPNAYFIEHEVTSHAAWQRVGRGKRNMDPSTCWSTPGACRARRWSWMRMTIRRCAPSTSTRYFGMQGRFRQC